MTLIENKSTFTKNSAIQGGVVYCDGCVIELYDSIMVSNFALNGAVIYAKGD